MLTQVQSAMPSATFEDVLGIVTHEQTQNDWCGVKTVQRDGDDGN